MPDTDNEDDDNAPIGLVDGKLVTAESEDAEFQALCDEIEEFLGDDALV